MTQTASHLTLQSSLPRCSACGRSPAPPIAFLPFLQERSPALPGASPAWAAIRLQFGAGLNLRELASVSEVARLLAGLDRPPRDVRRSFPGLIRWLDTHWSLIAPCVALVQLRDSGGRVIDGRRELFDRYHV